MNIHRMPSIGTTVQLNSGGCGMTVESVSGDKVGCVWHAGQSVRRDSFFESCLRLAQDPKTIALFTKGFEQPDWSNEEMEQKLDRRQRPWRYEEPNEQ